MSASRGSGLGVSSAHEQSVSEFLRFARFKRGQCVKTVEAAFQHLADSRLVEDTFTCDEVREMLEGLCGVVKAEVDSELINSAHTHAVLLRQLFQTADRWHLNLEAKISELENRELLQEIAQFEQAELSSSSSSGKQTTPSHKRTQLEPLNYAAGEKLLHMKINELEEENKKLRERCQTIETKASSALRENDRLKSTVATKPTTTITKEEVGSASSEEITALEERIVHLQTQLGQVEKPDVSSLRDELAHTAHELLRVTAELKETKEELDKKFSETAQFVNMKKMLTSKNDQIKKLRAKLEQYESGAGK